jgi:hypothetical protein
MKDWTYTGSCFTAWNHQQQLCAFYSVLLFRVCHAETQAQHSRDESESYPALVPMRDRSTTSHTIQLHSLVLPRLYNSKSISSYVLASLEHMISDPSLPIAHEHQLYELV